MEPGLELVDTGKPVNVRLSAISEAIAMEEIVLAPGAAPTISFELDSPLAQRRFFLRIPYSIASSHLLEVEAAPGGEEGDRPHRFPVEFHLCNRHSGALAATPDRYEFCGVGGAARRCVQVQPQDPKCQSMGYGFALTLSPDRAERRSAAEWQA
uniref:Uncharacterized protein n=1 Tax=Phaeomonas parva TaxID=124430 RepID=A0A7S1TXA3_9STRA|mmetsp:Transcript_22108/g.67916  ORF Transcript_22108/g.67916 Transcript_22108/m.67916 type:complete len:154 (+) Transcript_22108:169-630(+)